MTEQEYKELQAWCKSSFNKGLPTYTSKVELRNTATSIRRNIIFYKTKIKEYMFILGGCKEEEKISKWKEYIEQCKQARDLLMEKFKQL
jgi:hypothetical protein